MEADFLDPVDWTAPWLEPWRGTGEAVAARVRGGMPLHQALNRQGTAPVSFVPHRQLPEGMAYERFIAETRTCPTRANLHDLFNGLAWLAFPQVKARLNTLHAAQISADGISGQRGRVRDAITLFDESGALLHAPPALWSALVARDWRRLFIDLRPLWDQARPIVFGHALLEKLTTPRKKLTAHVWCTPTPATAGAAADAWLAGRLDAQVLATKPFTPLPVLGVPLWWAGNEDFSFYDDLQVFRPPRA